MSQNMRMKISASIGAVTLLMAALAYGQRGTVVFQIDIPFKFSVGKTALQAGTYQFSTEQNNTRLTIRGAKDSAMTSVITQLAGGSLVQDPSLVFDSFEGNRVLSEVWVPGAAGLLVHSVPNNHNHEVVVALPKEFAKLSGKQAFEHTCQRCHGAGGKGDADADKFFKKSIPRLNSDYVQSKSDSELQEIITRGKSDMPPVRLDRPGIGHLLPADAVGAVIAYVRTLKGN